MADFGKRKRKYEKERIVDYSTSQVTEDANRRAAVTEDQTIADTNQADLILAIEKNKKVLDIATALGEENSKIIIPVPPADSPSNDDLADACRLALRRSYSVRSNGGVKIDFSLFRLILDTASDRQAQAFNRALAITEEEAQGLGDNLNSIDPSVIASILSGAQQFRGSDLVGPDLDATDDNASDAADKAKKEAKKELLKTLGLGVAALGLQALEQHARLKYLHEIDEKIAEEKEASGRLDDLIDSTDIEREAFALKLKSKARLNLRIAKLLGRLVDAVILYSLIHNLSKPQTQKLAQLVVPPDVDDSLTEEFKTNVVNLYDIPAGQSAVKANLIALSGDPENGDESIVRFCIRYIERHPLIDFDAWSTYAVAKLRDSQLKDFTNTLSDLTPYTPETFTETTTRTVKYDVKKIAEEGDKAVSDAGAFKLRLLNSSNNKRISKYLPELEGSETMSFNVFDYIKTSNAYAESSSKHSNAHLSILKSNKYTPELVCCLINYLIKGNKEGRIDETLDFLKSLKNMLSVMGRNYNFDIGDMLEDVVNGLFHDMRSKLHAYAYMKLTQFMERSKKHVLDFVEDILDKPGGEKTRNFLVFCTPIMDVVKVIMDLINEFGSLLESVLDELNEWLSGVSLSIKIGTVRVAGNTRYRNIIDILDSIIFAMESGKLCNFNRIGSGSIHPDAYPIIQKTASLGNEAVNIAIDDFQNLVDQVKSQGLDTNEVGFQEPDDPDLAGAVPLERTSEESIIDTIIKYSDKCQSFEDALASFDDI